MKYRTQLISANAEVDYVVSRGPHIFPVEVKAGKSGTLRSVNQFAIEKGPTAAVRFDTNKPTQQLVSHKVRTRNRVENIELHLLSLPLYAAGELDRLLDNLRRAE